MAPTVAVCKFVGTISLGLLTVRHCLLDFGCITLPYSTKVSHMLHLATDVQ